jgi:hypothetical protein
VPVDRLRLLASAIAGRAVDVVEAGDGDSTWTDGSTIHLDEKLQPPDAVLALAVQASLLSAGSLEPEIVRALHRRPAAARRYLAVEGHRALAAHEELLPPGVRRVIDHSMAARSTSPEASLAVARGRVPLGSPLPAFGELRTKALLAAADRAAGATAASGPAHVPPGRQPAELEVLEDGDDGDDDLGDLLSSPVGGGGPIGKLFARLLSSTRGRSGGGPPGADAPTHVGGPRPGGSRRAASSAASTEAAPELVTAESGGATYPEWDGFRRRYREAWCTVSEDDPPTVDGPAAPPYDDLGLERALARLGVGLERCRRRRQGDDLDVDAVVEARVDAEVGGTIDDAPLYIEPLRRRRDLSVLVLLDVSGSAAEIGTGGRPVHEHQRRVAASMADALHGLGDRVAVYAFNSRGRRAVQLLRVKAFDDHLDGAVGRRLTGLAPGAYTRLGAAIRHGTAIVEERAGTPRRLLVVLSDGFAYDHGYEGRYGEADARRALLEARRQGVGCVCLSVGTDVEPAALQRVFGTAAHATVPRVEELRGMLAPMFREALRSAEAQHRSFQRTGRTNERRAIERRSDGGERSPLLPARR